MYAIVFSAVLLYVFAKVTSDECPNPFQSKFNEKCYHFLDHAVNRAEAERRCIHKGGGLASIHSAQENSHVQLFASKIDNLRTGYWIGGVRNDANAIWGWSDDSIMSYKNIADNKVGNCLMWLVTTKNWHPRPCGDALPALCYVAITCPPHFHHMMQKSNKCLHTESKHATQHESQKRCEVLGGQLANLKDPAQSRFVETHILPTMDNMWIGGQRNRHGQWLWSDGTAMQWANWMPGEPNNSGDGEHCVHATPYRGRFQWNDLKCGNELPSVCEVIRRFFQRPRRVCITRRLADSDAFQRCYVFSVATHTEAQASAFCPDRTLQLRDFDVEGSAKDLLTALPAYSTYGANRWRSIVKYEAFLPIAANVNGATGDCIIAQVTQSGSRLLSRDSCNTNEPTACLVSNSEITIDNTKVDAIFTSVVHLWRLKRSSGFDDAIQQAPLKAIDVEYAEGPGGEKDSSLSFSRKYSALATADVRYALRDFSISFYTLYNHAVHGTIVRLTSELGVYASIKIDKRHVLFDCAARVTLRIPSNQQNHWMHIIATYRHKKEMALALGGIETKYVNTQKLKPKSQPSHFKLVISPRSGSTSKKWMGKISCLQITRTANMTTIQPYQSVCAVPVPAQNTTSEAANFAFHHDRFVFYECLPLSASIAASVGSSDVSWWRPPEQTTADNTPMDQWVQCEAGPALKLSTSVLCPAENSLVRCPVGYVVSIGRATFEAVGQYQQPCLFGSYWSLSHTTKAKRPGLHASLFRHCFGKQHCALLLSDPPGLSKVATDNAVLTVQYTCAK